jgi:hypothetical protein
MDLKYEVEMLAFGDGTTRAFGDPAIRTVTIPDDEHKRLAIATAFASRQQAINLTLEAVFKWGQNDFQPLPMPSVSVGDVIRLHDGSRYRVEPFGFAKL